MPFAHFSLCWKCIGFVSFKITVFLLLQNFLLFAEFICSLFLWENVLFRPSCVCKVPAASRDILLLLVNTLFCTLIDAALVVGFCFDTVVCWSLQYFLLLLFPLFFSYVVQRFLGFFFLNRCNTVEIKEFTGP
jgi:hypothetical protein